MDYRKKIRKRIFQRLIIMMIIFAAFAAGFVVFELGRNKGFVHAVECAVIMLAVYIFILWRVRLVQMIADKNWEGTVEGAAVRAVRGGKKFFYTRGAPIIPLLYLTVRKDNGKKYKAVYEVSRISVPYYAPGTRVIHLRGSEYLLRPDDKPGAYVCPLCANTLDERYCRRCNVDFEKEFSMPKSSFDYFE